MASTLTICVAVFTICILLSGTIAPSLLIQEVDAKKAGKDTRGKKGEVCGDVLCSEISTAEAASIDKEISTAEAVSRGTELPKNCKVITPGANLSGCDFRFVNLSGANLSGANLSNAKLSGANLANVRLDNAQLIGVDLTGAVFNKASFVNANLTGANLSGTDLTGVDMFGAVRI